MSNTKGFLPRTDLELLSWSTNFRDLIVANYAVYGLVEAQATTYSGLHTTFATKLQLATEPITRTQITVSEKDVAREALKVNARLLAKIIEGQATVTDAQKLALGLNVRKTPTPIPVPSEIPEMDILSVTGRTVKARLHGETIEHRRKPTGCSGAYVWTFAGEVAPEDLGDWSFWGNTTKTVFEVEFAPSVEAGTKVWLCAGWVNAKGQLGPVCEPINTYTQFGGMTLTLTQGKKKAA